MAISSARPRSGRIRSERLLRGGAHANESRDCDGAARGDVRAGEWNARDGGDQHAPTARLPSPASELGRSRRGDRLLHAAVSEHLQGELGRLAGAEVAQQRHGAVHQGRDRRRQSAPQTAIWHFGWHVTDVRKTLATYKSRPEVKLLPLYTTDEGGSVLVSSDTWPRHRRRARPDQGADRRREGQRRQAAGRRRLRLSCRVPTTPSSNIRATSRPSASTTCTCSRKSRSARSSGTRSTSTRRCRAARRRRRAPRPIARCARGPTAPGRRSTARACSARRAPASSSATSC